MAGALFSSLISDTRASVVSNRAAIDAAFCNAVRVTFVGSITPAAARSSYPSVSAGIADDLTQRLLQGAAQDVPPDRLVPFQFQPLHRRHAAQQRHAASRHDPFLYRGTRRVHRVLHPRLLLFQLGLRRRPDPDHRYAAHQLCQPASRLVAIALYKV